MARTLLLLLASILICQRSYGKKRSHFARAEPFKDGLRIQYKLGYFLKKFPGLDGLLKDVIRPVMNKWSGTLKLTEQSNHNLAISRKCYEDEVVYTESGRHCRWSCIPVMMCGRSVVPEEYLQKCTVLTFEGPKVQTLGGVGLRNTDLLLFLDTDNAVEECQNYPALSFPCSWDSATNRRVPNAGMIHLCPMFFNETKQTQVATLMHEMLHIFVSLLGQNMV
ncbi:hypothetical protein EG68_11185 [Paragonimus skrjabini miyazakii]|uniref:Leishmanolysin-like peptidase n=1 Tax=Paragonimus skrjabini miyazakii TaxID=59628 RepID=A0A8S9YK56_9TREM|nr:hypothetical protein EG68_11185 [Paragonimus skrjabini miyazakii]